MALDDGIGIHLLDEDALVGNPLPRDDLQAGSQFGRPGARMRLEEPDHHVGTALCAAMQLFKRRVRLADARRNPEINTVSPTRAGPGLTPDSIKHLLRTGSFDVSHRHFTPEAGSPPRALS